MLPGALGVSHSNNMIKDGAKIVIYANRKNVSDGFSLTGYATEEEANQSTQGVLALLNG